MLEVRFRQCPGHRKIIRKDYLLLHNFPVTRNEYPVRWGPPPEHTEHIKRTFDFRKSFYPGRHVLMYMLFELFRYYFSVCPGCNLGPPENQDDQETEIIWYNYQAPSLVQYSHIVVADVVCHMSATSSQSISPSRATLKKTPENISGALQL